MSAVKQLRPQYVDSIPNRLEGGVIYISRRFSTAIHQCCCGCGLEVVTPIKRGKWSLTEHGGKVTLFPSIGNWSFPCRSHYWIRSNRVEWSYDMSDEEVADVRRADRAGNVSDKPRGRLESMWTKLFGRKD